MYFVSLYATKELHFTIEQIVILLVIVQVVAVFATAFLGLIAKRWGEIRLLVFCSAVWTIIVFLMYFLSDIRYYYYISALTGLVVGATPAIGRGLLSKIIPREKRAEMFGFNSLASRVAVIVGPIVFGIVASLGGMRLALLTVLPFFAVGAGLFLWLGANIQRWQSECT